MKQDCTMSQSTANEKQRFQIPENQEFLKGTHVSEPDEMTGSEIEMYTKAKSDNAKENAENQITAPFESDEKPDDKIGRNHKHSDKYEPITWSYIFVHNQKVKSIEEQLKRDGITHFIHKTIKYVPRHREKGGVHEVEVPSVSGLIFIQGFPGEIQNYLNLHLSPYRLCKNCSTGKVATIPCNQMEPFMRLAETDPNRLRFLLRPFLYYSKNRTLLRIVTGEYAGLEGYVIRIARDRKLVMEVGGMAVAISGIHAERFEEVHKNEADKTERETFYKRNLHERNAFIDRYFHRVKTVQEVAAQAENIDILRLQTLKDVDDKKLDLKDAFDTFYFMIEEIGYYYAPFVDSFRTEMSPIFEAGRKIMAELKRTTFPMKNYDEERFHFCETEFEALQNNYGYLFE